MGTLSNLSASRSSCCEECGSSISQMESRALKHAQAADPHLGSSAIPSARVSLQVYVPQPRHQQTHFLFQPVDLCPKGIHHVFACIG